MSETVYVLCVVDGAAYWGDTLPAGVFVSLDDAKTAAAGSEGGVAGEWKHGGQGFAFDADFHSADRGAHGDQRRDGDMWWAIFEAPQLAPQAGGQAIDAPALFKAACDVFAVRDALGWMTGPLTALGDRSPIDLVERGEGDRPMALLAALGDGAYL